jgi:hypothetical protein
MTRLFLRLVAAMALSVIGCKAVPDEDTLDRLRNHVASIPIEVRSVMAKWAANRTAYGYLLHYQGDAQLGTIECEDESGKPVLVKIAPMSKMYECLNTMRTSTYLECLALILTDVADETPDLFCEWSTHQNGLAPGEIPEEFKADRSTDEAVIDMITRALIGPYMPPPEIQLMLMGIPGFVGPGGALCPQGVDWACAPNPLEDQPGTTTSAATGGGDL